MLLGSTNTRQQYDDEEALVIMLLTQSRYAEAYVLLQKGSPNEPSIQYNIALCHFWRGNYQETLISLDKALMLMPASNNINPQHDQAYASMREFQNQSDDHLNPVTKKYIAFFDVLTRDAIIRLKTDCWVRIGDFSKVIETATPIAHKNYKNIAAALQIAKKNSNHEQ
jgi:tetratricopeptide (TPR) repeat protein